MISKRRRQLVGSALRSHPSTEPIQFLSRVLNGEMQPAAVPDSNADVTSEETPTRIPVWFRIVAVIALLWNLMGCAAFAAEMLIQEEMMKTMTPEAQEWAKGIPGWIYVVYFLAVSSGTLACIGLLVRKSLGHPPLCRQPRLRRDPDGIHHVHRQGLRRPGNRGQDHVIGRDRPGSRSAVVLDVCQEAKLDVELAGRFRSYSNTDPSSTSR